MKAELGITSIKDEKKAFLNCGFLHPKVFENFIDKAKATQSEDLFAFVELSRKTKSNQIQSNWIIKVMPDDTYQTNVIALPKGIRTSMSLSITDSVTIQNFLTKAPVSVISELSFELIQMYPSKLEEQLKIEVKDINDEIRKSLILNIVNFNQQIALSYNNIGLLLKITSIVYLEEQMNKNFKAPNYGRIDVDTLYKYKIPDTYIKSIKIITGDETQTEVFKNWDFSKLGIGGLKDEISEIFQRAFNSRRFPPEVIANYGIKHVRGMLLYGPPGTGKTLIARQLAKVLNAHAPKIVNGPELFSKYVGESEEKVRALFKDAEIEEQQLGDQSKLHIIIFDEFDAICRPRGSINSGTAVHDTVVNQLLSKLDGVEQLNNVLVIAMTNRKDMIDEAALRPGRLEVHVEIGLPNEVGRKEIFMIHTAIMREKNLLGKDVDMDVLAKCTKNFTGAEIAGVVKAASSIALFEGTDISSLKTLTKEDLNRIIEMKHFMRAINRCKPQFGIDVQDLEHYITRGIIDTGQEFKNILTHLMNLMDRIQYEKTQLISILLHGSKGCGKTALAIYSAIESKIPFVKLLSNEQYIGLSEIGKVTSINNFFHDSYKSPVSVIILDNIENLIDYNPVGTRFSNITVQALISLIQVSPPYIGRKLMIIGTTSDIKLLNELRISDSFIYVQRIPNVSSKEGMTEVIKHENLNVKDFEATCQTIKDAPIKYLLQAFEDAKRNGKGVVLPSEVEKSLGSILNPVHKYQEYS